MNLELLWDPKVPQQAPTEDRGPILPYSVDASKLASEISSESDFEHFQPPIFHSLDDGLFANLETPFLTGDKVAVIVEDRPLPNLVSLILHFSSILGPEWPIVLFTTETVIGDSTPLFRAIHENRIFVKKLPFEVHALDPKSISTFLTKPWIWNQLAPAGHVLLFQSDSMICGNSPMMIEDFLQFSFISAPVNKRIHMREYNDGLSLRDRKLMLEVIELNDQQEEGLGCHVEFEDQWFYRKLKALQPNEDGTPRAIIQCRDVASRFAVKTIAYDWPLGYSQPRKWQPKDLEHIETWCHEILLAREA